MFMKRFTVSWKGMNKGVDMKLSALNNIKNRKILDLWFFVDTKIRIL